MPPHRVSEAGLVPGKSGVSTESSCSRLARTAQAHPSTSARTMWRRGADLCEPLMWLRVICPMGMEGAAYSSHPRPRWRAYRRHRPRTARLRPVTSVRVPAPREQHPGHQAEGKTHAAAVAFQYPAVGHDMIAAQGFAIGVVGGLLQHHLHRCRGAGDNRALPGSITPRRASCTAYRRRPWRSERRVQSQVRGGLSG